MQTRRYGAGRRTGSYSSSARQGSYTQSFRGSKKNTGEKFDPRQFINKAIEIATEAPYEPTHTFDDFGFAEQLARNIAHRGYINPTHIQDESIPHLMQGKDVLGLANTGTGKTAAFILPIVHHLLTDETKRGALIIAPTRELAAQIDDEFKSFSKGLNLHSALCVGGMNIVQQKRAINRGPQLIIGTPGRLKDLVQQGALSLEAGDFLVLDEADRMLDMGFQKDIDFLIAQLPSERQSMCFSATITPEIKNLLSRVLKDHVSISVKKNETNNHIEQEVVHVSPGEDKLELLYQHLVKPEYEKVIVFGATKHGVQKLSDKLNKRGLHCEAIHGNKSQPQRQKALNAFKDGTINVLFATDVAARGLDIPNVSHVINYDLPQAFSDYVHRIGRTGRAGKAGHAVTFF